MRVIAWSLILMICFSCSKEDQIDDPQQEIKYFPSISSVTWNTADPDSLNWNLNELENLKEFLEVNNTRAFLILKSGKIVVEEYWGRNILDTEDFTKSSNWYWASAGKSLTAFLTGLAQEEGLLDINESSSTYLGENWTSLTEEDESKITVKDQLTMSTGLDFDVGQSDCTDPQCLLPGWEPGTRWFYHNAPYTLIGQIVSNASNQTYNEYTANKLFNTIGMDGLWIKGEYNNVFWSTARSAARFGLLIENKGDWDGIKIMQDSIYFESMVNSSQEMNPSYGYLWWLNGKSSIIYPGLPTSFNTSLAPSAPADMIAAMGKNGQFIEVIPSKEIVIVRFGDAPDNSLVPIQFHNDMWDILSRVF